MSLTAPRDTTAGAPKLTDKNLDLSAEDPQPEAPPPLFPPPRFEKGELVGVPSAYTSGELGRDIGADPGQQWDAQFAMAHHNNPFGNIFSSDPFQRGFLPRMFDRMNIEEEGVRLNRPKISAEEANKIFVNRHTKYTEPVDPNLVEYDVKNDTAVKDKEEWIRSGGDNGFLRSIGVGIAASVTDPSLLALNVVVGPGTAKLGGLAVGQAARTAIPTIGRVSALRFAVNAGRAAETIPGVFATNVVQNTIASQASALQRRAEGQDPEFLSNVGNDVISAVAGTALHAGLKFAWNKYKAIPKSVKQVAFKEALVAEENNVVPTNSTVTQAMDTIDNGKVAEGQVPVEYQRVNFNEQNKPTKGNGAVFYLTADQDGKPVDFGTGRSEPTKTEVTVATHDKIPGSSGTKAFSVETKVSEDLPFAQDVVSRFKSDILIPIEEKLTLREFIESIYSLSEQGLIKGDVDIKLMAALRKAGYGTINTVVKEEKLGDIRMVSIDHPDIAESHGANIEGSTTGVIHEVRFADDTKFLFGDKPVSSDSVLSEKIFALESVTKHLEEAYDFNKFKNPVNSQRLLETILMKDLLDPMVTPKEVIDDILSVLKKDSAYDAIHETNGGKYNRVTILNPEKMELGSERKIDPERFASVDKSKVIEGTTPTPERLRNYDPELTKRAEELAKEPLPERQQVSQDIQNAAKESDAIVRKLVKELDDPEVTKELEDMDLEFAPGRNTIEVLAQIKKCMGG